MRARLRFHEFSDSIIIRDPTDSRSICLSINPDSVGAICLSLMMLMYGYIDQISIVDPKNRKKMVLKQEEQKFRNKDKKRGHKVQPLGRASIHIASDAASVEVILPHNDVTRMVHWYLGGMARFQLGYQCTCFEMECQDDYWFYWEIY